MSVMFLLMVGICVHVPMSLRARTSAPGEWHRIKVTEICGDCVVYAREARKRVESFHFQFALSAAKRLRIKRPAATPRICNCVLALVGSMLQPRGSTSYVRGRAKGTNSTLKQSGSPLGTSRCRLKLTRIRVARRRITTMRCSKHI